MQGWCLVTASTCGYTAPGRHYRRCIPTRGHVWSLNCLLRAGLRSKDDGFEAVRNEHSGKQRVYMKGLQLVPLNPLLLLSNTFLLLRFCRMRFAKNALLLGALQFASLADAAPADAPPADCYRLPGDADWPATQAWSILNSTVNGKLVATVPIGSPCHDPTYDADACSALKSQWLDPLTQ